MSEECRHSYKYSYLDLVARNSVFSKKVCDKCGKVIVLSRKSKTVITVYMAACCALFASFSKYEEAWFPDFPRKEVMWIAFFAFLSLLVVGTKFILDRSQYVLYK